MLGPYFATLNMDIDVGSVVGAALICRMLYRDLSVDERPADGQRQGADLLQRVLAVRTAL